MRPLRIAAAVLLLASSLVAQTQAGQAAASFPRIDASGFALVSGTTFQTYGARIAALEADPRLAPARLTAVLGSANRTGRPLCHPTYIDPALNPVRRLLRHRRVCPEYADDIGDGVDYPSCLHRGIGGVSTTTWTKAPKNTDNLSHWPATGELWPISEQLRERVTVHVGWPG